MLEKFNVLTWLQPTAHDADLPVPPHPDGVRSVEVWWLEVIWVQGTLWTLDTPVWLWCFIPLWTWLITVLEFKQLFIYTKCGSCGSVWSLQMDFEPFVCLWVMNFIVTNKSGIHVFGSWKETKLPEDNLILTKTCKTLTQIFKPAVNKEVVKLRSQRVNSSAIIHPTSFHSTAIPAKSS